MGPGGAPLADIGQRFLGLLIDLGFMIGFFMAMYFGALILAVVGLDVFASLVGLLAFVAAFIVQGWFGYLIGVKGASPGMALLGLRCVEEQTGQVVGGGQGVVRALVAYFASCLFYLHYWFALTNPKRQTLGDSVVKSVVIAGAPKQNLGVDLFTP